MMEKKLPDGWEYTTIEKINLRKSKNIDPGLTPTETFELYSVPIFDTKKPEIIDGVEIKSSKQIVEEGEVLICKINPRINRVWSVGYFTNHRKIASSEWIVVNTKGIINSSFLKYQFSAPFFREIFQSEVSGVGGSLTRARPKLVENYPIYLAPLAEQKRIVAKLDMAFGHLETLKVSLARIPELLKAFRQSVLTQAVTGKLTENWRKGRSLLPIDLQDLDRNRHNLQLIESQNKGKSKLNYKKAVGIEIGGRTKGVIELLDLPESWQWVSMDQVLYSISDGPHFSPKYVDKEDGVLFISSRNIFYDRINFDDAKYVSKDDHITFTYRGRPMAGDVLLTKGGTTGIAHALKSDEEFSIWVHVALLKVVKEYISPEFLRDVLTSNFGYCQSQAQTHGVGNQDLGLTRMIYFAIPLPSFSEQQEIVHRVESLFSKADAIESKYLSLKEQIDKLPQALLAKAFRGELMPQDPDDEPASVLLEKIQKEMGGLGKKGKKQMELVFED